jgi:hypothetical protein
LTNIKVIPARDFVRATQDGHVDFQASKRMIDEIVASTQGLDEYEILIDVRGKTGCLAPEELWRLAEEFVRHGHTFQHRTAVLCAPADFGRAKFVEYRADHHGLNIEAFVSYEEAMEWLISA